MAADVLTKRALNRATLSRQFLLERASLPVEMVIDHLVGMQAQNPFDPYYGLWARLDAFDPGYLAGKVMAGEVVRASFMRATLHMLTTDDALRVHPTTRGVLERVFRSTQFAKDLVGMDMGELLELARASMEEAPRTRAELARALGERWPDRTPSSLAQAATYLVPVLQVPPRGVWGRKGQAVWSTFSSFSQEPYGPPLAVEDFALRYLGAFGPAAVKDMRAWSGLTGLREVFEGLRPRLRSYRDESGVELFDLPDLELPDPETPAPPRLLPEYDNVLLGHSDRSRFFDGDAQPKGWVGNVLVDGVFAGSWKVDGDCLHLHLTQRGMAEEADVVGEARRLIDRAWPDDVHEALVTSF
jgi:Winged helix DNA-binding domain